MTSVGAQETSRVIPFNSVATTLPPNTLQDVTVQLWDAAGGGSPLFSEAQPGLAVDINGNINFVFGSLTPGPPGGLDPNNFPSGSSRFVDVVNGKGNSVLATGRLPLTATPFALSPAPAGPALPFVTVAADGTGDYADLQSALNSLGSTGGRIVVKAGAYNVGPAGIRFSSNNITVEGAGPTTRFNFIASSLGTCFAMADTTQRSNIRLRNFRISQQATPGTGVGVDFSYFAQSLFEDITVDGVNGGFLGNATGTLYNRFYNCTATVSGPNGYGFKVDNRANENSFYSCRTIRSPGSPPEMTGFVVNAHATKLFDADAENGQAVGIDIQSSGNDCLVAGPYLEGNAINIQFASGVQSPTIIGGVCIDATTSNINNLGASGLNIYNLRLQYQPFTHRESQSGMPSQRWIKPYFYTRNASSQPATAARVYLLESELTEDALIDGVSYIIGSAIGGNVTVGLYGPISNEETCDGAPLVVQSESTPQAGIVNQDQLVSLVARLVHAGRYYVAIEFDGAASTYNRNPNLVDVTGWSQHFDRSGGYGALPTRCPPVANSGSAFPLVKIRLKTLTTL
jgi:hypothetical protein